MYRKPVSLRLTLFRVQRIYSTVTQQKEGKRNCEIHVRNTNTRALKGRFLSSTVERWFDCNSRPDIVRRPVKMIFRQYFHSDLNANEMERVADIHGYYKDVFAGGSTS